MNMNVYPCRPAVQCPVGQGYKVVNGRCLGLFYAYPYINQTEAKARCVGHLADIKTKADRDALPQLGFKEG